MPEYFHTFSYREFEIVCSKIEISLGNGISPSFSLLAYRKESINLPCLFSIN